MSSIGSSMCAVLLEKAVPSSSHLPHLIRMARTSRPSLLSSPVPASDVVVRVVSSAINPSDVKNALGDMPHTVFPRILGRDFSGLVVATGSSAAAKEWMGAAVYGTGGDLGFLRDGAHAEYIRLPAAAVARKPTNLTFEQAACVGVNFVTAYTGLYLVGKLTAADTVLITGASGGVGTAVRQLAEREGAAVIAVDRTKPRDANTAASTTTPAAPNNTNKPNRTHAIYLSDLPKGMDDLPSAVNALPLFASEPSDVHTVTTFDTSTQSFTARGRGASLIFDVVGGAAVAPLLHCLASNGRLVNIATKKGEQVLIDLHDMYRRQTQIRGANSLYLTAEDSAAILRDKLTTLFEQHVLTPLAVSARVDVMAAVVDGEAEAGAGAEGGSNGVSGESGGGNAVGAAYESVLKGARGKVVLNFDSDRAQRTD